MSKRFSGTRPAQPFLNVALLGLLSLAPARSAAEKLRRSVTRIDIEVADVPRLMGFTALESLSLFADDDVSSDAPRATDLSRFGPMPNLRSIQLSLSWIVSLKGLHAARVVDAAFGHCTTLTDLGPLSELKCLVSLELNDCEALTDLGPLSGLQSLARLDLGSCWALNDLGPLSVLKSLESLNLSGYCGRLEKGLSVISNMKSLIGLRLSGFDDDEEGLIEGDELKEMLAPYR